MNSRDVMGVVARHRKEGPVMIWPANTAAVLNEFGRREPTLASGVSLSYVSPLCFGLAFARPDLRVVAIDGDGSLIASLPFLTTLGRYPLKNLVLLVIDNGFYRSTDRGELPTATHAGTDLCAIAKDGGIERAVTVDTVRSAEEWIDRAFREEGPFVIVAKVDPTKHAPAPSTSWDRPDRTEASMMFRRWFLEHPLKSAERRGLQFKWMKRESQSEGPGRESGRIIYQALKDAGINLFVYLPESVTYPVQELAEIDPEMPTLCCAREDEGIAMASGAYYGGMVPAIVMEGSGVGYSGLILANCILRRTPVLIVSSHSESLGVRFDHDTTSRLTNEPILRALQVPYQVLERIEDAPYVFRESVHEMRILKLPVGVVIPPYIMSDRGLA